MEPATCVRMATIALRFFLASFVVLMACVFILIAISDVWIDGRPPAGRVRLRNTLKNVSIGSILFGALNLIILIFTA